MTAAVVVTGDVWRSAERQFDEPYADAPRVDASDVDVGLVAYMARAALTSVAVVALSLVVFFVGISALEHKARQVLAYDRLRSALATGTAPTGQLDASGRHLLPLGTPVALIDIPKIGVNEVVGEGTTASVLESGPGLRRDTPLPGQAGTSVIMGRQAAFGGPFGDIHGLRRGDVVKVTVGFGSNVVIFRVIDVRHQGDPRPPLVGSNQARLTLVTASGTPFMPSGLVYVDADATSPAQPGSPTVITGPNQLMRSEAANATDSSNLWQLILWLEALLLVSVGSALSWYRWGHRQTWIVFLPALAVVGYFVAGQIGRLVPNLL